MLKQALQLKDPCVRYCECQAPKFSLSELEWKYVEQMCDLLQMLSKAINMLCQR